MDDFHFGNLKAEKASAPRRQSLFAAVSRTFRIAEFCAALLLLSWTLTHLPSALQSSAENLRKLSAFATTPHFVFALSNAIIAALLSRRSSSAAEDHANRADSAAADRLYEEFLKNRIAGFSVPLPYVAADEAEYEDKGVISETSPSDVGAGTGMLKYRRSESEKWKLGEREKSSPWRKLRRSRTEKVLEDGGEEHYPQDKMSSEEFKRTVEAFIAKQMKFLREESSSIVLQNPS